MKQDKYERNKKRTNIIFTVGIAFIMIASIFAIVLDNQSQGSNDYNKHTILSSGNGYKTKINGKYMEFYYYPGDLERIPLSADVMAKIKNSQGVAFIFDPTENVSDNLQYIDVIRYDLQTQMDKPTYFGITKNSTKYTLSIVTCANATQAFPFILINMSTDTGFNVSTDNPNCIIMNAKLRDLLAAKDRLIYTYYGVMTPN